MTNIEEKSEVGETGSTSDPVSTNLPTYFSYRLTVGHEFTDDVTSILRKYSDDWCMVLHNPDSDDHNPHFHIIIDDWRRPGIDWNKKVACLQKAFKDRFKGKGNGFHAGKWMDNDRMCALQYFSHDPVRYLHFPDHWAQRIKDAPVWVPNNGRSSGSSRSGPRERLGDPTLSFSNVVKQALKYRETHCMDTSSLTCVLSRMVNQGQWIPSRDILTNGVPRELHELFVCRVNKRKWDPSWMYPHDRSDRKQEWLDRPDLTPYPVHDPIASAPPTI